MGKKYNGLKITLPLLAVLFCIPVSLLIAQIAPIDDRRWYQSIFEVIAYAVVIAATYFISQKLFRKCFPQALQYSIGRLSPLMVICLVICVMAYFVIEQRVFFELYFSISGEAKIVAQGIRSIEQIADDLKLAFGSCLVAPIFEETIFRRLCLSIYDSVIGKIVALISISVIFGALHYHNPCVAIIAAVNGLIWGIAYLKTKKLIVPIILHIAYNVSATLYFVLYYSGMPGIDDHENSPVLYFDHVWVILALAGLFVVGIIIWRHGKTTGRENSADKTPK